MKMKRYLAAIFLAVMFLPAQLTAQEYVSTPVEISQEKIKVDGKVCYSHVVLEKQTLYSISKAYGVTIDDIYKYNPSTKENGLKKNSIIIIPFVEIAAPAQPKEVVQQTVAVEPEKPETPVKNDEAKAQRIHTTKWTEDLDVIAEMYGVTVEDIIKANNLKGRKLARRQKLIIPFPGENLGDTTGNNTEAKVVDQPADTTVAEVKDEEKTEETPAAEQVTANQKTDIKAAILLPLSTSSGNPNADNLDFYCGSLLAIYDLGKEGINTRLSFYDSKDRLTQENLETLNQSDVIIGPVSAADLTRMFNIVPQARAVVSPLDIRNEKLTKEHGNLIHIPTPAVVQYQDLISWLEEEYVEGDRVIMISEKGARMNSIHTPMKQVLDSSSVVYSQYSYSILEGRDVSAPLTAMMTATGKNRVVIASESEAFVNDVVRNLNLMLLENFEVVLYAPSKIRSFETIEVEHFHKTAMRVSLTYYINYDDPAVRNFLLKYRALYNTEPSQFAFQGYDIANYFISMVSKYGDNWMEYLQESEKAMLQSSFRCMKQGTGGYVNTGVRRIVYGPNWTITQVK